MSSLRKTPAIVVFFLFFSAAAVLIEAVGLTAAMGVESPTGVSASFEAAQTEWKNVVAAEGVADTLFGSFIAATSSIEVLARGVFSGPLLLTSAGIPAPFVAFLFAPAGVIVLMDILHYLTGRGA